MTRQQFIEKHRDQFAGLLLDSMTTQRAGADGMVWLRRASQKIDAILTIAYDDLAPKEKPITNGTPVQPARK